MAGYFEHRRTSDFFKNNGFRSNYELIKDNPGSMELSVEDERLKVKFTLENRSFYMQF